MVKKKSTKKKTIKSIKKVTSKGKSIEKKVVGKGKSIKTRITDRENKLIKKNGYGDVGDLGLKAYETKRKLTTKLEVVPVYGKYAKLNNGLDDEIFKIDGKLVSSKAFQKAPLPKWYKDAVTKDLGILNNRKAKK